MSNKSQVKQYLDDKFELIEEINDKIWNYAEVGLEENRSVKLYEEILTNEEFDFKSNIAGMPTAFVATYGSGKPVIGITAEYDALPGLSQEAGLAQQKPIKDDESGHGCGHNSLGAAAFGGALAVKEYLKNNKVSGTIKLFGSPSEEKDNGKTFMAREGYFDDLDAAYTWHPKDTNEVWSGSSLANISVIFNFKGKTSHAAISPHLGRSALDSAEIMNIGANYLREHIIPEARMHYAYHDVGGTAPNVVQGSAKVHYLIRAPKTEQVLSIFERLKDVAKGAALITGTESSFDILTGLSDYIPNPTLSTVLHDAMVDFGPPEFNENDFSQAREFLNSLDKEEQNKLELDLKKTYGNEKAMSMLENPLDTEIQPLQIPGESTPGSTDVGDLSYVTPTAQLYMATTALGTPLHTWQMVAQGNTPTALKGVKAASGALALASIHLIEHPSVAEEAREELNNITDGKYVCPIPEDVQPNTK